MFLLLWNVYLFNNKYHGMYFKVYFSGVGVAEHNRVQLYTYHTLLPWSSLLPRLGSIAIDAVQAVQICKRSGLK